MHAALISLLVSISLMVGSAPGDRDSDGDGLSDYQETHKYFTDPEAADSDGDGTPDGDWEERREFAYTIRSVILVMPPYNKGAMNDDYQDVRVLQETDQFVKLEVIHYPLNAHADAIEGTVEWRGAAAKMTRYLNPGVTTNWDEKMKGDLLSALREDGIEPEELTDRDLVEKVTRWLMEETKNVEQFTTYFVHFPEGRPEILPGLEAAFEANKGEADWSTGRQLELDVLGKEMFYHRTRGSCTSAAVYQTTVLRALGIPTRMIIAIPVVDASDPIQRELVWTAIRHRQVREAMVSGIAPLSDSFAAHTLNEVFVGGRWRRLNYSRLGQNNLDRTTMGLLTHVHTFGDLSEADLALTWGKRYGKGEKDKVFQHRNPYRALELSDRFGIHGKIQVERGSSVPTHLTISKVYWYHSEAADPWLKKTASRDRRDGDGYLIAHVDEWDANMGGNFYSRFIKRADRHIVLAAEGQPNVTGRVTGNFWASLPKGFRELEILISKEELEKMKPGIDYSVIPRNSISEYRWKLSEEITVRR